MSIFVPEFAQVFYWMPHLSQMKLPFLPVKSLFCTSLKASTTSSRPSFKASCRSWPKNFGIFWIAPKKLGVEPTIFRDQWNSSRFLGFQWFPCQHALLETITEPPMIRSQQPGALCQRKIAQNLNRWHKALTIQNLQWKKQPLEPGN